MKNIKPRKKFQINEQEVALFKDLLQDVTPMEQDKIMPYKPVVKAKPKAHTAQEIQDILLESQYGHFNYYEYETGEELHFCKPGLEKQLSKLKRGQYKLDATLDLHGYSAEEAYKSTLQFLHKCRTHHYLCVKIIHGKGKHSGNQGPVLKPMLNHCLCQWNATLAFCSAKPEDGGTGALYLLLKRL